MLVRISIDRTSKLKLRVGGGSTEKEKSSESHASRSEGESGRAPSSLSFASTREREAACHGAVHSLLSSVVVGPEE